MDFQPKILTLVVFGVGLEQFRSNRLAHAFEVGQYNTERLILSLSLHRACSEANGSSSSKDSIR